MLNELRMNVYVEEMWNFMIIVVVKLNSNTLVVSCAVKSALKNEFTLDGRGR